MDKLLEQGVDVDVLDQASLIRVSILLLFSLIPYVFLLKYLEIGIIALRILPKQDGLTALHTAIIGRKDAVISHLLRKGASPRIKDRVRFSLLVSPFISFFHACTPASPPMFNDCVYVTGWRYTSSLCYSSWCNAHCEFINEIQC